MTNLSKINREKMFIHDDFICCKYVYECEE